MRKVYSISVKEIKDLVRDRYVLLALILAPLIVFPLMTGVLALVSRETSGALVEIGERLPENIAIVLEDPEDEISLALVEMLKAKVEGDVEEAIGRYKIVVVLHANFTESLLKGRPAAVSLIYKVENPFSLSETITLMGVKDSLEKALKFLLATRFNLSPDLLESPLVTDNKFMFRGELVGEERLSVLQGVNMGVAFVVFLLGLTSLQVGMMSIGFEREARTIEVLLTFPARRWEIIAGKALGVSVVSFMSLASLIAGLLLSIVIAPFILPSNLPQSPGGIDSAITFSPLALIQGLREISTLTPIIIVSIALAMIASTILGLIIGILLIGDLRGALSTGSYTALIFATPLLVEMLGVTTTSLQPAFLMSPMYPPFRIVQSAMLGEWNMVLVYMGVTVVYIVVLVVITSMLARTEWVIHGIRLKRAR